jgi:uncharacterized membrane protein
MTRTPGAETSDAGSGKRKRWIIVGIVVLAIAVVVAAAGWYYLYGGTAPDAPTIDNALQQLLPTAPPE